MIYCDICQSENHNTIEHHREMITLGVIIDNYLSNTNADVFVKEVRDLETPILKKRLAAMSEVITLNMTSSWRNLLKIHWQIGVYEREAKRREA